MNTKNDGGGAFPVSAQDGSITQGGMSLRDYFAAKALPELVEQMPDLAAKLSYEYADAMLKQREKNDQ